MLRTVEGIFRDGRVELEEVPSGLDGTRVLVTFLSRPEQILLQEHGITSDAAAEARWRFGPIAEDWERPEMDVYDEL